MNGIVKNKKKSILVPVLSNQQVTHDTFCLTLQDAQIATQALSGQFVNVFVPQSDGVLWRRPFGIHKTSPEQSTFELLYKRVGRGTAELANLKAGESLDIIGPLGNTFSRPADLQEVIIVAGGIGIAPFPLFIQHLKNSPVTISVFYGAKAKNDFCCLDFFKEYGVHLHLATEDGSLGEKGYITDSLLHYLQSMPVKTGRYIYVCGPTPMLARMKEIAGQTKVSTEVSVETIMACGFGACMGCPVTLEKPDLNGGLYALACKDGPVFNMDEIRFDE